jgi:hypothetical protein
MLRGARFWGGDTQRGGDRLLEEALRLNWGSLVDCLEQHINFQCRLILKFEQVWGSMLKYSAGSFNDPGYFAKGKSYYCKKSGSNSQSRVPTDQKAVNKLKRLIEQGKDQSTTSWRRVIEVSCKKKKKKKKG